MMFGRTNRDKLPAIDQPIGIERDDEVRDRDKQRKEKGKEYADEHRNAKPSEIKEGDEVWLKQVVQTNKLAPTFIPSAHKVVKRNGAELLVENMVTKQRYRRNVSHALKVVRQV